MAVTIFRLLRARRDSDNLRRMKAVFQACPPRRASEPQRDTGAGGVRKLPAWLKWSLTVFLALWLPAMFNTYGAQNVLWLCEVGNLFLVLALWLENRLLLSALLDGLLLVDLAWGADLLVALASNLHPFGATANMFDPSIPLPVRLGSLFHLAVPAALLFAVARLGYDRRGFLLQTAITTVVLTVSYLATTPLSNVNWVFGLGALQQTVPAPAYLLFCMVAYPLILYLPVHLVAARCMPMERVAAGVTATARRD